MLTWMRSQGKLSQVGVEGTGAYGAGLARYLHDQCIEVLEVPRPDRRIRRQRGKSDPIDAEAAARTVLAGKASGAPKLADGPIEAIRMLRVARNGAVKARTAAAQHPALDGHHRPRTIAHPAAFPVLGAARRRLRTAASRPGQPRRSRPGRQTRPALDRPAGSTSRHRNTLCCERNSMNSPKPPHLPPAPYSGSAQTPSPRC